MPNLTDLNKKIKESLLGFLLDKLLSIGAGLAAFVLADIYVPVTERIFSEFVPLRSFWGSHFIGIIVTTLVTAIIWGAVWKHPRLRFIVPLALSIVSLITSSLMGPDGPLPEETWIAFLLYFSGILLICETLAIHVGFLICSIIKRLTMTH